MEKLLLVELFKLLASYPINIYILIFIINQITISGTLIWCIIMRPTAHFSSSIVVMGTLYSLNITPNLLYITAFVLANVLIDLDFIFSIFMNVENHRTLITHNIIFWFILIQFSLFLELMLFFWISFGCFVHLMFDLIDFGLPHISKVLNLRHLIEVSEDFETELDFASSYWGNNIIVGIEVIIMVISIFVIIVLEWYFNPIIMTVALICLFYSAYEITMIINKGNQ